MLHREKFNRPGDSEGFVEPEQERPASIRIGNDEVNLGLQEVVVVEPDYKLLQELFPSLYLDAQREAERMKVKP